MFTQCAQNNVIQGQHPWGKLPRPHCRRRDPRGAFCLGLPRPPAAPAAAAAASAAAEPSASASTSREHSEKF